MPMVTCPFCKEQGRIPKTFIGKQIKCSKCKNHFVVTAPPAKAAAAAPVGETKAVAGAAAAPQHDPDEIAIEGLDGSSWEMLAVSPAIETGGSPTASDGTFTAAPSDPSLAVAATAPAHAASSFSSATRQYKLLMQKDKFFEGKFELPRLEDAINHYAREGWTVKSMVAALVHGFSGGPREEIVILLER